MKVKLTVIETVTHEITVDITDDLREVLATEDVDVDDTSSVQDYFRDLEADDQLITDVIGDNTVVAVTDRSIDSVKVED